MPFHIVLVEPEIPPNTGNISRLCAVTGTVLHLVQPLGFSLGDRYLKRAGLDYWHLLDIRIHENWQGFTSSIALHQRCFYLTTKAEQAYTQPSFRDEDILVFGPETRGLPASTLALNPEQNVRIPMLPTTRSLNLSSAVAIVLYEALRQTGFPSLEPRP